MSKTLSPLDQLHALKAEYAAKEAELKNNALSELNEQLKAAKAEVVRIEGEIAELSGHAPKANAIEEKPKGRRLKPIEKNSEEWNKVSKQIGIVLKNYPQGLNGKDLAYKMGLTAPNEIKRIKPVIAATTRREGEGVGTRYFIKH